MSVFPRRMPHCKADFVFSSRWKFGKKIRISLVYQIKVKICFCVMFLAKKLPLMTLICTSFLNSILFDHFGIYSVLLAHRRRNYESLWKTIANYPIKSLYWGVLRLMWLFFTCIAPKIFSPGIDLFSMCYLYMRTTEGSTFFNGIIAQFFFHFCSWHFGNRITLRPQNF